MLLLLLCRLASFLLYLSLISVLIAHFQRVTFAAYSYDFRSWEVVFKMSGRPEHQAPPEIFYGTVEAEKYSNNTRQDGGCTFFEVCDLNRLFCPTCTICSYTVWMRRIFFKSDLSLTDSLTDLHTESLMLPSGCHVMGILLSIYRIIWPWGTFFDAENCDRWAELLPHFLCLSIPQVRNPFTLI